MKKTAAFFLFCFFISTSAWSSPWAEGKDYGEKTGGKAIFGVKNVTLGWTALFTEPVKYQYYLEKKKSWEGLCVGISKAVLYTATGAVHLVTFPIPVDFPDMGEGVLQTSVKDQAAREQGKKNAVAPVESAEATAPEAAPAA